MACAASQGAGAPLADVLDGVATAIRADEEARRHRDAALAGPRATAAVLTWLPLAGIGLGLLTGSNAPATLLGTSAGRACLVVGAGLWAAGRWWMSRLLAHASAAGPGMSGRPGGSGSPSSAGVGVS
jgi:tight adherence protein B